mgnify:CR=1 FL=1
MTGIDPIKIFYIKKDLFYILLYFTYLKENVKRRWYFREWVFSIVLLFLCPREWEMSSSHYFQQICSFCQEQVRWNQIHTSVQEPIQQTFINSLRCTNWPKLRSNKTLSSVSRRNHRRMCEGKRKSKSRVQSSPK